MTNLSQVGQDAMTLPTEKPVPDKIRWRILAVVLIVIIMSLVSVSIVNVALPSIQRDLGVTQSDLQWVLSGYALTFGIVLVAAGRAGDILGRGGLFLIGVVIFTISSVAAGFAQDAAGLNTARFIQGIGSGLLNPQSIGMIQEYFRGAERGRAFGYFGTAVGFSVAIGPVLGGFVIEIGGPDIGWRSTFLINVPIGIVAIILGLLWFPKPLIGFSAGGVCKPNPKARDVIAALDPLGSLLLGLAVLAFLFPFIEGGSSTFIWLLLPLGLGLLAVWVLWENHYARLGKSPMVNLKIFSTRSFRNGATIMVLYFLGMTSVWVLVALYVQKGNDKTALESGMIGVPAALLSAWAAHWAGKRVLDFGRKIVIGGIILGLLGLGLSIAIAFFHDAQHISIWWLAVALSFIGLAQGAVISPNQTLTLADVPLDYAGSSGAVMQTGQRIGTSVGIALITAVTFFILQKSSSWTHAFVGGFTVIILVLVMALCFAVADYRNRH